MTITRTRLTSIIAASLTTIIASATANASLDTQFSSCAAKAIESKSIIAKKISVELPSSRAAEMDHDSSSKFREYKMGLINPKSGEELGQISCRVNQAGKVESVTYLSKI